MSLTNPTLVTSDGLELRIRHYPAAQQLRGVVVCLHGIQSHSGWYEYSSQRIAASGFEVYFPDRRGAGLNQQLRGHADHGLRLVHDVRQLVRLVRRRHPDVSVTLLGVSWGGKVAAAFAATYPRMIDQLALLYPGLEPRLRPTWWQLLQLNFARRHDIRHRSVAVPLRDPALFTDVREHQQRISDDPLTVHNVTSGLLNSGRDLDKMVRQRATFIAHPMLLMLAGRDQIVDNTKTRQRVASFASRRVTTIEYPEAGHTLEFDSQRELVFSDLIAWLTRESGTSRGTAESTPPTCPDVRSHRME